MLGFFVYGKGGAQCSPLLAKFTILIFSGLWLEEGGCWGYVSVGVASLACTMRAEEREISFRMLCLCCGREERGGGLAVFRPEKLLSHFLGGG